MAKKKPTPVYKVGQIVCRVGKGIAAVNSRLAIAEVGIEGHDNSGRARPAVRAWSVHWDGKRGEKALREWKGARPAQWLLVEIGPCKSK